MSLRQLSFATVAILLLHCSAQAQQTQPPAPMNAPIPGDLPFTPTPPDERLVGIAYTTWHQNPNWTNSWGTPSLGFYASDDRRVIRQHAQWLADAGVDFIWVDWSNDIGYVYDPNKKRPDFDMIEGSVFNIFDEYAKMRAEGKKTPNISIFAGVTGAPAAAEDGRLQRKADQIWNQLFIARSFKPTTASRCWWCMSTHLRLFKVARPNGTMTVLPCVG